MRITSFRRTVATLLAAALGTGTLVAGVAGPALPAAAAERNVVDGNVHWGVKASFRNYITGPIAHGTIEVRDPATRNADGTFRFADATGTADPDAGTADLAFAGEIYFAGHDMGAGPLLQLTVSDPRVHVTSATDGVLIADVVSKSLDSGELVTYDDVELAELDLADHPLTFDGDTVSADGVPATLTAEGVPAFADFYTAGTALDPLTFTATLEEETDPEPVWEPAIEVFAADGTTPAADAELTYGDTVVVKGSGFDPAGNIAPAGTRPPISVGAPAGTYVVFGKFADAWRPSQGAPSSSRVSSTQKWTMSQAALDQVPAQYQGAIRAQWVEVATDGTFTAELLLAKPTNRTTGETVEWPETGTLGVYTYAAGGTINADQELSAPLTVAEDEPDPDPTVVTDATFEWGINLVSQYGSPAGGCSFFVAGVADGTEASYKVQDGDVYLLKRLGDGRATAVTAENRCFPLVDDKINQRALFTEGTGEIDGDGAGTISWTGAFTVYSYGGMVPWYVKDPVLTLDGEGNGAITAEAGGFSSSMEDPTVKVPLDPEPGVTILELSDVTIEDGAVSGTPVWQGVDYFPLNDPADPASGRWATSAIPDTAKAGNPNWGSWPTPIVDFHYRTGLSSYWHTSGLSADPNKPPLPVLIELDGGVPEFVDVAPITITQQPQWALVVTGEDATFTVAAESEAALTYQWQRRAPGATDWQDIEGATGTTLTLAGVTAADTGTSVRVIISNGTITATSGQAGVQAEDAQAPTIWSSPKDATTFAGYKATFNADITGWPRPTYQWQTSDDGGTTWTDNGESGPLPTLELTDVPAGHDGLLIRAVGSNGRGPDAVTETAELTVLTAPTEPTLVFAEGTEYDPAGFLVIQAIGGGYPDPADEVGVAVVETDVWAARDETFDPATDAVTWRPLNPADVSGGFVTAGLFVQAGAMDATKDYVFVTFSTTPGDFSHDAAVAIPLVQPEPVWEPSIEVFAADGTTPAAEADLTYGDTVVVKGSGFDPEGNIAPEGTRPPISVGAPAGTYVVFGKFADLWQPSQGAPSSSRVSSTQKWTMSQAALDQVPAQYQGAIRAQWVEVGTDGTFTAELLLAKPTNRQTGETVEWPETGTLGVYTYAAGGTVNADQELSAPLTVTEDEEPAGPALTLSASTGLNNAGTSVIDVTGAGFEPDIAVEVVQAVRVEGASPVEWPKATGAARVMTNGVGEFLVPASLKQVTSRFVVTDTGVVYDCKVVECVVLAFDFNDQTDRTQDVWAPITFDDAERPAPSVTLDTTEFPAEGGSATVTGGGFIAGDHLLVVQTSVLGSAADPRELPRNPAGTSQIAPGEGDGAWALRLGDITPTFTTSAGVTVDCREVECAVAVFPSRRADLAQSVFTPITFAGEEPPAAEDYLDWGLKESFRDYVTGPIAHGSIEVREPATLNADGTFRFNDGTGTGDASAAELGFAGEVYFSGHVTEGEPALALTLTDPRVTVSGSAGTLVADVVSKSLSGGALVTYDDVELAELDFTEHPVTVTDGVASASGVPATLMADGAAAFAGFYTAGTELDPVTFAVALDDEPPAPTPTVTVSEVEDLDPYADQVTVTGSGFTAADLAGGLRVGIGALTGDGSVPALNPVETVTFEAGGLLAFARAALLGEFEVTLTTQAVEPGTTLAVYTSPVDPAADPAFTTQTPITFAEARTPQLTVTPTEELAIGTEVTIEGTGFAPNRRISLAFTPNAEKDDEFGWPAGWLQHDVVQADADGTLSRTLVVAGTESDSGVDCVATACYVASFSSAQAADATPVDYRSDRSQDVFVPVTFADGSDPEPEPPAVTVDPDPAVQGEPVTFTGTGFEPGTTVTAVVDRDAPPVGAGTLDWGVKASFRNYIVSPIAHGDIEVRDPATRNADGTFRFAEGAGDATALSFGGEVYFSGHDMGAGPLLELTITDPRVQVASETAGVLVADVVSKALDSGELVTYDDVELAALDFTDHPVTETDGVVAASGVPATLTADGVAAFADFYEAGTELDPVTFSVPTEAAAAASANRATAPRVDAGTGTVAADGNVEIGWTVPADLAVGAHTVDLLVAEESLANATFTVEAADEEPEPEPEPDPEPAVTVDPGTVAQGETVTFTGTGFGAEESVEATVLIDAATEELTFENDHGQTVTVRSADGNPLVQRDGKLLVVDGGELDVTLTGLEPTSEENTPESPAGFYLLTAVDNGPGEVATPAIGGADTTGESGTSRWITTFPYPGSEDIVVPIADGVAETSIGLVAADDYADCEAGCVLYLRTDHRSAANRAFDLRVPLEFVTAAELAEAAEADPVTVTGTTNADGEVTIDWTVPADSPVGPATVTLRGAEPELTASAEFTVTAASTGDDDGSDEGGSDGAAESGSDESGSDDGTGDDDLPDTGTDPLLILGLGLALLAGGVAVALYDRRRRA